MSWASASFSPFTGCPPAAALLVFDDEAAELRDLEDADAPGLTVEREALERYRREMDTHCRTLAAFCSSEGVPFVQTTSSLTFEELTYRLLRAGIWRNR